MRFQRQFRVRIFLPKAMLNGQDSRWEPVVAEQLLAQNKIDEKHPLHLNVLYDDAPLHVNIAQRVVGQLTQSDMLRVDAQPVNWQTLQTKRQKGGFPSHSFWLVCGL